MKAETDLYCPNCGTKIHEKGDELRSLIFPRAEECCSQCSTVLRRRSGGGQNNPWYFHTREMRAETSSLKWLTKLDPRCLTAFEKRFPGAFKVVSDGLSENENSPIRFTSCARMFQTYWTGWLDAKEVKLYWCEICSRYHNTSSKIGTKHLELKKPGAIIFSPENEDDFIDAGSVDPESGEPLRYLCNKCGHLHKYTSKIGVAHRPEWKPSQGTLEPEKAKSLVEIRKYSCKGCRWINLEGGIEPCESCFDFNKWEAEN